MSYAGFQHLYEVIYITIEIRAPSRLRSDSSSIWYGSSWMELETDHIDITINNDVKIYNQVDEETQLNQLYGAKMQVVITGYLTIDSDMIGVDLATKSKNLTLAGREWYYGLRAHSTGFPEFKWNDTTRDFLFQKIMTIDSADIGDKLVDFQLGLIIKRE